MHNFWIPVKKGTDFFLLAISKGKLFRWRRHGAGPHKEATRTSYTEA